MAAPFDIFIDQEIIAKYDPKKIEIEEFRKLRGVDGRNLEEQNARDLHDLFEGYRNAHVIRDRLEYRYSDIDVVMKPEGTKKVLDYGNLHQIYGENPFFKTSGFVYPTFLCAYIDKSYTTEIVKRLDDLIFEDKNKVEKIIDSVHIASIDYNFPFFTKLGYRFRFDKVKKFHQLFQKFSADSDYTTSDLYTIVTSCNDDDDLNAEIETILNFDEFGLFFSYCCLNARGEGCRIENRYFNGDYAVPNKVFRAESFYYNMFVFYAFTSYQLSVEGIYTVYPCVNPVYFAQTIENKHQKNFYLTSFHNYVKARNENKEDPSILETELYYSMLDAGVCFPNSEGIFRYLLSSLSLYVLGDVKLISHVSVGGNLISKEEIYKNIMGNIVINRDNFESKTDFELLLYLGYNFYYNSRAVILNEFRKKGMVVVRPNYENYKAKTVQEFGHFLLNPQNYHLQRLNEDLSFTRISTPLDPQNNGITTSEKFEKDINFFLSYVGDLEKRQYLPLNVRSSQTSGRKG